MKLDASTITLEIFTFKEGLLSAAAHDLVLRATSLSAEVTRSPLGVMVTVDPQAIQVDPSVPGLSEHDRAQIEKTMRTEVLDVELHPTITFRSTRVLAGHERIVVEGTLVLLGRMRALVFVLAPRGDRWETEFTILQPDFGIHPYTAMLGALKVKSEVRVRASFPKDALAGVAGVTTSR